MKILLTVLLLVTGFVTFTDPKSGKTSEYFVWGSPNNIVIERTQ